MLHPDDLTALFPARLAHAPARARPHLPPRGFARRTGHAAASLLAALLAACGSSSPAGVDAGDLVDAPSVGAFCEAACADAPVDGCLAVDACVATCEADADGWDDAVRGAFASCAADEPLCFETVEDCMLRTLHPTDAPHPVRVTGSGFTAFEGLTLHAWSDPERPPAFGDTAVITDGAFSFSWTPSFPATLGDEQVLLFYVDVDGDGACTSAADVTAAAYATWNGDLVEPAFDLQLAPPLADPDFVCDLAP